MAPKAKKALKDLEDPLARLLSDDEEGIAKKLPVTESKTTSHKNLSTGREPGPSIPLTPGDTPVRKKDELLFDDKDDIMATLGFGDSPTAEKRQMGGQEGPQPARSKLDELLGRGTATKLLARPGTGEQREFKLDKKCQRSQDKEDTYDDEVLTFGAYQPTWGSSEGRQSHPQSVRLLTESGPDPKGELSSKWSPPAASSPVPPRKGGADWLGLKDEDLNLLPASPTREPGGGDAVMSTPSIAPPMSQHSASGLHSVPPVPSSGTELPTEGAMSPVQSSHAPKLGASQEKEEAEDWLGRLLAQKKSQRLAREEHTGAYKTLNPPCTARSAPSGSQPVACIQEGDEAAAGRTLGGAASPEAPAIRPDAGGSPTSCSQAALALSAGDLKRKTASGDPSCTDVSEPAACFLSSQKPTVLPVPVQSLVQNLPPGTGYQKAILAAQAQLQSDTGPLQAELLQCPAQLAELEAQVRKLELEQAQHRVLLESWQQRHQADLELIESALRSQMEQLSSSLKELASHVEALHLTTSQERKSGIRQQDEQLRVLQERLDLQQRAMEEHRRLQEDIGKMEERLSRLEQMQMQVNTKLDAIISLAKEPAERQVRTSELQAKEEQLARDREAVAQEQQELRRQQQEVRATAWSQQLRAQEMEHMSKAASKKYEEGELALQKAQKMKAEQLARLQVLQRQHEQLRQQEEHVLQEQLSLAKQRMHLGRLGQDLPCCPLELPPRAQNPVPSSPCAACALVAAAPTSRQLPSRGPSQHLQPLLVWMRYEYEQNRAFLEDERLYLESLENSPYHRTSHSD
ncbi:fas-binding factor 1 isoform X2 [Octodon degus]|uniref:Fas-binding factor 1 isoform X2 n=1 Tax=Octodon degus TaxID=10160 RepID=A0A6P6ECW1_OCTDE|nr:fas-binding factor 1 isoform X2 [Octodon degus]